ncbi:hypothetical protein [uncultured Desulfobacter sp.]|uniref:hypothetical protein n=1 Tax=uncultured Desulfobacter sp. TaxID=240139 RepID=UPI002AAB2FD1|nr:hypothetical protein [uncultured Desulfobacter sp.]
MIAFLSILGTLLSVVASFIAGWFVATDKNRNELFKQKLESYKKLSAQVAKVYTLGGALEKISDSEIDNETREDVYKKEAVILLNMTFSEMLFLEQATLKQVYRFIQMKPSEYNKNKEEINKIIDIFREDLSLQRLNVMNQLSTLALDIKKLLYK